MNSHFMSPAPGTHNIDDISEEMREKALKRTATMLQKFEELRRAAGLPVDQLPIVIDTYSKAALALIAEAEREDVERRTRRVPLTIRSERQEGHKVHPVKIKTGEKGSITTRPQVLSFRPEDFSIHGDPSRWLVHDILCGNRSQFAKSPQNGVPGTKFGPSGMLASMRLDTLQTAMDLVLVVEYIGPDPEGEVFEGTFIGTALEP
jgi:hypothetical protein